jgi:hypothetical protein
LSLPSSPQDSGSSSAFKVNAGGVKEYDIKAGEEASTLKERRSVFSDAFKGFPRLKSHG